MKSTLPLVLISLNVLVCKVSAQGQPQVLGVYPSFGSRAEVAPGEEVGAFGPNLIVPGGSNNVSVSVNGISAPVNFAANNANCDTSHNSCITFQIPPQTPVGAANLVVSNGSASSNPFPIQLVASAPDLNTAPFPSVAAPGQGVTFYVTGLGAAGPTPSQTIAVTIGGLSVAVGPLQDLGALQALGGELNFPGVYSFTVTVPAVLGAGSYPVTFSIAGVSSNTATLIVSTAPSVSSRGVVPVGSTVPTIQPGEWVSIYGFNLASSTTTWNGDFPTSLGGTNVKINGKSAYLWYVSPTQINLQSPDDTATGPVPVVVTTALGTATSTVTLAQFGPAFLLLDNRHVTGIILRSNGSGAYGGGSYDILGPTGNSLGYATVAAKPGDTIELFAVGLGPTNPTVLAGQAFSDAAPATNPVNLLINNVSVTPAFAGLSGAGLYQINLTVPAGLGTGDVSLVASVGGVRTPPTVVISLQ